MDDSFSLFPEDCYFEPLLLYPELANLNFEVVRLSPSEIREILELGPDIPDASHVADSPEDVRARLDDINEYVLQHLDEARDPSPGLDLLTDASQGTIEAIDSAPDLQLSPESDHTPQHPVTPAEETHPYIEEKIPNGISVADSGWKNEKKQVHTCVECARSFKDYQKYWSHKQGHLDGARICPICNKVYASATGVRLHTQRMHQQGRQTLDPSRSKRLPTKRSHRSKIKSNSKRNQDVVLTNPSNNGYESKQSTLKLNEEEDVGHSSELNIVKICEENILYYELNTVEVRAEEAILRPFKILDDKRSYLMLHRDGQEVKNEEKKEFTEISPTQQEGALSPIYNMTQRAIEDETIRKNLAEQDLVSQEKPPTRIIDGNCSRVRNNTLSPFLVYEEDLGGVIEENIHSSPECKKIDDSLKRLEENTATCTGVASMRIKMRKRDEEGTEHSSDSDAPLLHWKKKKAIDLLFSSKLRRSKIQKSITYVNNKKTPVVAVSTTKPVESNRIHTKTNGYKNRHRSGPQKTQASADTLACETCERHFKNEEQFTRHMSNHGNPRLSCQTCKKVFASSGSLNTHQKLHQRKYKCDFCTLTYDKVTQLEAHKKKHATHHQNISENSPKVQQPIETNNHKNTKKNQDTTKITKINHAIHVNKFKRKPGTAEKVDEILKPEITKQTVKNQVCEICGKRFDRVGDLKRHYIEHVARQQLAASTPGPVQLVCDCCQATFLHLDQFKAHLRWRAGLTLYTCILCDKTFSNSSNFSKHKKVHDSGKFKCEVCGKKFITRKMLIAHLEFHEKTGVIQCPKCPKLVYSMSMLKKHLKVGHRKKKEGDKKYGKSGKMTSRKTRRYRKSGKNHSTREVNSSWLSPNKL